MQTDTVISHFVIWTSLSPLSSYNGSQRTQRSKQATAGIIRHITFTVLQTLKIIRKAGNATSHSIIMAAYRIGLLNMHGTKKHNNILSVRTEVGRGRVW
jgi:hypothetical protein